MRAIAIVAEGARATTIIMSEIGDFVVMLLNLLKRRDRGDGTYMGGWTTSVADLSSSLDCPFYFFFPKQKKKELFPI